MDAKFLNKILINQYNNVYKELLLWDLLQVCNTQNSINVIHYFSRPKRKIPMIISRDTEKAFDKIQHPLLIKSVSIPGTQGQLLQIN
jgi:hypothetical protein